MAVVVELTTSASVVLGRFLEVFQVLALVGMTVAVVVVMSVQVVAGQAATGQAAALTAAGSHRRRGDAGGLARSLVGPASAKRRLRRLGRRD